jgi:hypothetical protein
MSILELPLVYETRRNHALEHATLNILAQKYPDRHLAGHSNPTGFFILGQVPTEDIKTACAQALSRLKAGEHNLAIHPGCGTNYVTSGLLAGSLAWLSMGGAKSWRSRLWRLPFVIVLSVFAFMLGQPLGSLLQARITTEAVPGDLEIAQVLPVQHGGLNVHRVITHTNAMDTGSRK